MLKMLRVGKELGLALTIDVESMRINGIEQRLCNDIGEDKIIDPEAVAKQIQSEDIIARSVSAEFTWKNKSIYFGLGKNDELFDDLFIDCKVRDETNYCRLCPDYKKSCPATPLVKHFESLLPTEEDK